jgi:hypothetical protein
MPVNLRKRNPLPSLAGDDRDADRPLLLAIEWWENLPHNRTGADKTWVERLIADARRHYGSAVRVR